MNHLKNISLWNKLVFADITDVYIDVSQMALPVKTNCRESKVVCEVLGFSKYITVEPR